jgi:hypothetical protein
LNQIFVIELGGPLQCSDNPFRRNLPGKHIIGRSNKYVIIFSQIYAHFFFIKMGSTLICSETVSNADYRAIGAMMETFTLNGIKSVGYEFIHITL